MRAALYILLVVLAYGIVGRIDADIAQAEAGAGRLELAHASR